MEPVRVTFGGSLARIRAESGDAGETGDAPRRSIDGVLVPYNVEGRAADGMLYVFEPGSLTAGRGVVPFLMGHDRNRPIGVLASSSDSETELRATFSVDATPDGDVALAQAQSGSRGGLSVGAQPVLYQLDESGDEVVIRVQSADLLDASLVTLGAYEGALVTSVAAQAPPTNGGTMPPDTINGTDADESAPPTSPMAVELAAGHPRIAVTERGRSRLELCAGELVQLIVRAQHGERDPLIQAALTESISTDVSGLLPPTYERTVIGARIVQRPLYNAFKHRPLPGVGLQINKPKWTTFPVGGWAATVDADATTSKVVIGSQAAAPARWDWAGAFPWIVVQRSDPGLIDEAYGEAVNSFYLAVEASIYTALNAGTAGVAVSLGAAVAEFYGAAKRSPDMILMAADVWGKFADRSQLSTSVAIGGVSGSALTTSFAGIPAITSPNLAAGQVILATDRALDVRISEPVRLTANAIGALNVELAVVGEGLFDTDYPAELRKFAAVVPATAEASARAK